MAKRLTNSTTADSAAYLRLGKLVDTFGNRLSGSASLEASIGWALREMQADGLQHVRGEPVMVPHLGRGGQCADLVKPPAMPLKLVGLGWSPGTSQARRTPSLL